MDRKPETIEEFRVWYKNCIGKELSRNSSTYYNTVSGSMKTMLENSDLWKSINHHLFELQDEYLLSTQYDLLLKKEIPNLYIKPFASFEDKLYRKNIVNNKSWPEPPDGGWLNSEESFTRIKDIIRTSYVVKYLDGVQLLAENISKSAREFGYECTVSYEARNEGYYAAHVDVPFEFEIPSPSWDTLKIKSSFEIQITTQLQEVLKKLTHSYYETARSSLSDESKPAWQWNYKSEEFTVNYLGHILHYLEGMILEVRDRRGKHG